MDKILTVNKIVEICNGILISGNKELEVIDFTRDTREVKPGDMYIGIKGEHTDGNDYFETAFENGAMGVLLQKLPEEEKLKKYSDKVVIKVEDSINAIQKIAKYKRELANIPLVAITGSVGKTSTKDMVSSVIAQKFDVLKTEGNYNNHIGLPLTLLKLKNETASVLEMGMNHLGEISLLTNIAKPTVCILTNVGTSHIGNLGSRENILKAKLEILEGLNENGTVIINNDNDLLHEWKEKENKYNICTYGIEEKSDYMAYNISEAADGSTFDIDIENNTYNIKVPVGGIHFIYNSLCAIASGRLFGINMEKIIKGISTFKLTAKRMDIEKIENNVTVINDSYNASYDSMKAALEVLGKTTSNKKIAVLGDMLELGSYEKELHEKVGEEVVKNHIDVLITVGPRAKSISKKAKELGMTEIYQCENNEEGAKILKNIISQNDAILLKAANAMKLGEILEKLKEAK